MKNIITEITAKFPEVKSYGLTEVFIMNGEVFTTSNFDLPIELINKIEASVC